LVVNAGKASTILTRLLNQIRYDNTSIFFDDKYGQVPFVKVNAVVNYVLKELEADPTFPTTDFSSLLSRNPPTDVPPRKDLINLVQNLDEIVPILKIKYSGKLREKEISQFSNHILDKALDFLLETRYPNISPDQYQLAKSQQISHEPNVNGFKSQLFNAYVHDKLPIEIFNKLDSYPTFIVDTEITSENVRQQMQLDNVGTESSLEQSAELQEIVIEGDDPFLPSYLEPIKIDGKTFTSVITYAYSMLFKNLSIHLDVNAFSD